MSDTVQDLTELAAQLEKSGTVGAVVCTIAARQLENANRAISRAKQIVDATEELNPVNYTEDQALALNTAILEIHEILKLFN